MCITQLYLLPITQLYIDAPTKERVRIAVNIRAPVVLFPIFSLLIQNAPIMVNTPTGMTRKMIRVLIRRFDSSGSKIMSGESLKFGDVRSMISIMILKIIMMNVEPIAIFAVNILLAVFWQSSSFEVFFSLLGSILAYCSFGALLQRHKV